MTPVPRGATAARWDPALVPRLSARREPGTIRFELLVPGADADQALQAEIVQPLHPSTVERLQAAITPLLLGSDAPGFWPEARRIGELLFRTLIPAALRAPLAALCGGPLLVRTNWRELPWELLHDAREFWGFAYAIGTQLIASEARPAAPPALVPGGRPRALVVGADPDGDLDFVASEIERVVEILEPVADVACVGGMLASFATVSDALAGGVDLVHFCGHMRVDAQGRAALRLGDGTELDGATIERHLRGRPIVFLNGCSSARDPERAPLASLADSFLLANARAVVGTLHAVRDGEAQHVAMEFYRGILDDRPIGEALRRARRHNHDRPGSAGSGLGFVLFGNPALRALPDAIGTAAPVPPRAGGVATRRRFLGVVALAGTALALGIARSRRPMPAAAPAPPPSGRPMVIWIGPFQNLAGEPHVEPLGRALSDGLAAKLRLLHLAGIYSPADVASSPSEPPSEIEMVKRLGATKSVVGTYRLGTDRIDATIRIVDVDSGVAEPSFTISGGRNDLAPLQVAIAEQIVSSLRIVRMMLEGEGVEHAEPARPSAPSSALSPFYALLDAAAARADDGDAGIRALMERYRGAIEAADLDAVAACYLDFPDGQRAAQRTYLDSVRGLRVRVAVTRIAIDGSRADVDYVRTDDFTDARTGRGVHVEVRLQRGVVLADGQWRFAGAPRLPEAVE